MGYRTKEINVQPRTRTRLRLTLKLFPQRGSTRDAGGNTWGMTVDELADKLLNECVKEKFPDVIKLEKQIEQLEEEACERCANARSVENG